MKICQTNKNVLLFFSQRLMYPTLSHKSNVGKVQTSTKHAHVHFSCAFTAGQKRLVFTTMCLRKWSKLPFEVTGSSRRHFERVSASGEIDEGRKPNNRTGAPRAGKRGLSVTWIYSSCLFALALANVTCAEVEGGTDLICCYNADSYFTTKRECSL